MATDFTPSSRQARTTRSAISPRFAIRTFSNTPTRLLADRLQVHQHLLVLDRISVLDQDLDDAPALARTHLVHQLHRLDDAHGLADVDDVALLHERLGAGLRGPVEGPDEGSEHRHPTVDVAPDR